jgi:ribokinase
MTIDDAGGSSMKKMCVIGSLNIDMGISVDQFPRVGETVFSNNFQIFIGGGKGANQAVALGKLGADVRMVGKLGEYFYGPEYIEVLKKYNVECDTVSVQKDTFHGIAFVAVDVKGDNILFVYPGSNALVDVGYIQKNWDSIVAYDIFLFQLEIPIETNLYAMKRLSELGKTIILDPAPAKYFSDEMLKYADYVTPNETELETLSGIILKEERDFKTAGENLLHKGAKIVIAKAGKNGAYIITQDDFVHVEGYRVKTVDPTGAGDCFNAGFAYALADGKALYDSIRFAHAVAALSITALGAQSAMPSIEEVNEFIIQHR